MIDYQLTMHAYAHFVQEYNTGKELKDQIRGSVFNTGQRIIDVLIYSDQHKKVFDKYSYQTNFRALATQGQKSEKSVQRHIQKLWEAKIIANTTKPWKGRFTITVADKIVFFKDKQAQENAVENRKYG